MIAKWGHSKHRRVLATAAVAMVIAASAIVSSSASAAITYEADWGGDVGGGAFVRPDDVATDSADNLYVIDDIGQVEKFNSDGNFLMRWGTFGSGDGEFNSPQGIAVDSTDNVYVSDSGNTRIQKFDSSGTYLDQWSTDSNPTGIAIDSSDDVYVTEVLANQVERFDSDGNPVTSWGSPGTAEGEFSDPVGIATDSAGNVYVNELTNGRVQEFDSSGAFVRMFGWGVTDGSAALQTCTASCQAGLIGSGDGQIKFPDLGIAIDSSDNVYISEQGNSRIEEFDASGADVTYVRQWGSAGSGDSQFNNPQGIAIDPSNANVYVADRDNGRIQEFTSTGVFVATLGHKFGTGDGELTQPYGVATGAGGVVYVTDASTDQVQKFDANGNLISRWGTHGCGDGQFDTPRGVAVDSTGNVYVLDTVNDRVQKFNSSGDFVTKWGEPGSGPGELDDPLGIAIGPSGHVYVTDRVNARVQEFTSSGTFIRAWGTPGSGDGQFDYPSGIAVGPSGAVYVVDGSLNRIQQFTSSGAFVRKWGTPGSGNGQFFSPEAVATDSSGSVYVTDSGNNRIQKFSATGTFISKFGTSGFGDGEFTGPEGIATFPSTGSIYVADSSNSRIQKLHEDMTPPSGAHILGTYPIYRLTTPFNVSWGGATDPGSGVQSYKAFAKRAPFNGNFGVSFPFATTSTPGGASFSAKPGNTYCFSVKATDHAGNRSAPSAQKCSAMPLDDRSLTGAGWSRDTGTGYYRGTYSASTRQGARLRRTGVQAKRLALVATRCPGCGVVDVKRDGTLLKRVNLTATTTRKRQIIPVSALPGVVSGTITITIVTVGKPVFIDGLGVSRN